MWISLLAAWVIGSVVLYAYLVVTAAEPRHQACMDCSRTDCSGCRLLMNAAVEAEEFRKAA